MQAVTDAEKQALIDDLTDRADDLEEEDLADLPIDDIRAMQQRRIDETIDARQEIIAAEIAIGLGLEELDEDERETAANGLKRLLDTPDSWQQ